MTLYRQLLAYAFILLLCLTAGLWVGELNRTRTFLVEQLESHAQDTATSLGLSLSTLTDGTDVAAMEAMVSALFDRGYYRLIQLRDLNNQLLVDRVAEIRVEGVPAWFIRLVPLDTPHAEALIMHGWSQIGTARVESHPGYAYETLWQSALASALWFTIALLVAALLGGLGLRRLLRPLYGIEEQAIALCDRRFHMQDHLPRTRELRRVVIAMNRMTERIREIFDEQTAIADDLMQRAYQDSLTNLGNRRFLENQIQAKVTAKGEKANGAFLMVQIQQLQRLNQNAGYAAGDLLIQETAASIRQACAGVQEPILARLTGGDFALLLPNINRFDAEQIGNAILERAPRQATSGSESATLICGGVVYGPAATMQTLLAGADNSLNSARYRDDAQAVVVELASTVPRFPTVGKTEWKNRLESILANRSIMLYSQPTVSYKDRQQIVHHEILTRMIDASGAPLSAGMFIPVAEQFGLMPSLDRLIIERLFETPLQQLAPQRIAINLSPLSLADETFHTWLKPWLQQCAIMGLTLHFEFPEFQAIRHRQAISNFAEAIKDLGHGIGIDHFGQGLMHFGYLKSLMPGYVKIDRAITQELWNDQSDSYFFVNALCNVAHSLETKVIVEGVETEEQWQAMSRIHVDAVQGYLIRQPQPLQR